MSGHESLDYAYLRDRDRAREAHARHEAERRSAELAAQLATPIHEPVDERWLVLVGAVPRPPSREELETELHDLHARLVPRLKPGGRAYCRLHSDCVVAEMNAGRTINHCNYPDCEALHEHR